MSLVPPVPPSAPAYRPLLFKAAAPPQLFLGHGAQRVWRRTQQGSRIQPLTEPVDHPKWDTKKRGKFKTIGSQFLVENIKAAYEDKDIIWYNYINMKGQHQHQLLRTVESPSTQSMSVWASGLPRPDPSTAWTWVSHGPAVIVGRKKKTVMPFVPIPGMTWMLTDIHCIHWMYCIFLRIFLHTCFGQGNLDTGMATTLWYMLIQFTDNRG